MTIPKVLAEIQQRAGNLARHAGPVTNLYVPGESRQMTKEMATARALEADPELYGIYRAQHNAGPLVAALQSAGLGIRPR